MPLNKTLLCYCNVHAQCQLLASSHSELCMAGSMHCPAPVLDNQGVNRPLNSLPASWSVLEPAVTAAAASTDSRANVSATNIMPILRATALVAVKEGMLSQSPLPVAAPVVNACLMTADRVQLLLLLLQGKLVLWCLRWCCWSCSGGVLFAVGDQGAKPAK